MRNYSGIPKVISKDLKLIYLQSFTRIFAIQLHIANCALRIKKASQKGGSFMEAAGVEPASENLQFRPSTCVAYV